MSGILLLAIAYPAVIAILFYLAFLRPVQQQQKQQRQVLADLRVGDEVLTQAGFIATVKEVRVPEERGPTELVLDLGGTEVRALASAIVQRLKASEERNTAAQADPAVAQRARG
jgi:preprotein translocase YajC subunit